LDQMSWMHCCPDLTDRPWKNYCSLAQRNPEHSLQGYAITS
jgi:hypothetical protein